MRIASALGKVLAMLYRPLARLTETLGRMGLGLLRGRLDIPGEFRFFGGRSQEASKLSEARVQTAGPLGTSYPLIMETGELPATWDESTVTLLPVNPYLIHAYWYVDSSDLERASAQIDYQRIQPALRFYDVTEGLSREAARASFDVDIQLEARNWYVHLWSPAKSYYVDLGLRTEDGRFCSIARSNITRTPRAFPSDEVAGRYARVEEEQARAEILAPKVEEEHGRAEILPPPSPGMQAKAEAGSVLGLDTEFVERLDAKAEESRPAPQRLESAQIPQSSEPGRQSRFVACDDQEEVVDITASSERRLHFGISSSK